MKAQQTAPQTAIERVIEREKQQLEAFEQECESLAVERDDSDRDAYAASMDTNMREAWELSPPPKFAFATKDWNDAIGDTEMWERCFEIADTLGTMQADKRPAQDILTECRGLLDNSFSEKIKRYIIRLTSGKETVEGACRHAWAFYPKSDTHSIDVAMGPWRTLAECLNPAVVFTAFLERAWHLNPRSTHYPNKHAAERGHARRSALTFADPYEQLAEMNETAKRLRYEIRHSTDAKEIAKLASTQVRVLGALHVLNERLDRKEQQALEQGKPQPAIEA